MINWKNVSFSPAYMSRSRFCFYFTIVKGEQMKQREQDPFSIIDIIICTSKNYRKGK